MKGKRFERNKLISTALAAITIIAVSTLLFHGFLQVVTATEFQKTKTIPTSYMNYTANSTQAAPNSLPEGYQQANYTVGAINLEYYRNQTPTNKDMTKEDAAEIGAQALWEIFDLNLEGQVIKMGYNKASERLPRSSWYADVYIDGKLDYSFEVDSVTGELFSVARNRTLDKAVSLAFDQELAKNSKEYVDLAKKLAEKYNVVHGPIKSVEYNNQGYRNNDPDITMYVTGENGEMAMLTFSRYDKALLSIGYHTPMKYALEHDEKWMKQLQEIGVELRRDRSIEETEQDTLFFGDIFREHFGGQVELMDWEERDELIEEVREIVEQKNKER